MFNSISVLLQRGDIIFLTLIFISIVLITLFVLGFVTNAMEIKRRTQAIAGTGGKASRDINAGALIGNAAPSQGLLDSLLPSNEVSKSQLRKFLANGGFESRSAPMIYQISRLGCAVAAGFLTSTNFDLIMAGATFPIIAAGSAAMTVAGFYLPKTFVSMRRDKICAEHRNGFPDFLDLMVICTDAGVGVDAAVDRVSRDLYTAHPSLARNLQIMSLELRAGRSLRDALENLGDRLGIAEARSFATLLQQSEELGSSLVDSLRVYSDEMRQKRYARAEEKAHALPAKLVIPLGLFIFPVILGVTLFPVVLRIYGALGI